jgi:SET domain
MEIKFNNRLNGYGLYSTEFYPKSEIVYTLSGEIYDKPTKYTIHVENNVHILDARGRFMNHSFTPTTYIDGYNVVALIDINIGDELTFNYNETEINMASPFVVNDVIVCGKSC